jgi:hypothetical protein
MDAHARVLGGVPKPMVPIGPILRHVMRYYGHKTSFFAWVTRLMSRMWKRSPGFQCFADHPPEWKLQVSYCTFCIG